MTFDSLPSDLICTVLRDWISLKSVMAINSAYCHKSRRKKLMKIIQSSEYFIRETVEFNDCSTIWDALLVVGEKIRSISVEDRLSTEQGSLIVQFCHSLTRLHFKGISSCTDELQSLLATNEHLECVTLSTPRMHFTCIPSNFPSIEDMQSIAFLSFAQGWEMTNEDRVTVLQKNEYVTRLDFWGVSIHPSLLTQMPQLCPHLTHAGLQRTNVNDEMLSELVTSCLCIEHLDIADCELLTDIGVLAVAQNLKRIKSLNIMGIPKLTSTSLQHICAHGASTLHTLHMSELETVKRDEGSGEEGEEEDCEGTDHDASALNSLLEHCTQLRVFYYRYRKRFVFIPAAVRNLITLVLDGGVVSKQNLAIISQYGVNLHTLLVGEITTYSRASLLALVQGCPRLQRFYYELEVIDMHNIDDYDSNTRQFALAFMDLWMKLKPGLVAEQSLANRFSYKVMDM